jgi:hypothetical protein
MKTSKLVLPVLLLLAVSLSCKLLNPTGSGGLSADDLNRAARNLPTYDPKAPPPSPGAAALRGLAVLEPRVAELERSVEAAERAAIKTSLAKLPAEPTAGDSTKEISSLRRDQPPLVAAASGRSPMFGTSFPLFALWQGPVAAPAPSANDAMIIAAVVSGWNDQFIPHVEAGASVSGGGKEKEADGATSDNSLNLGRNPDGSTSFGIGIKSEVEKNGVKAKTDVAAKLDGQRCPNAEGQVSFTMKMRLGAETGGAGYMQELTALVRAVVNDDAEVASSTMDVVQGTRQVKGDSQFYIETGSTVKFDGTNYTESDFRVIRHSQQATAENSKPLSEAGLDAAQGMGHTALAMAKQNWQRGGCTKIEATSPGSVAPSSATAIPVTVRQRFDKSEVTSKLDAVLSGGESVDPATIAKTRGTLTYTAPGESGKSATIKLTATSRRGRSTLDLTASTGGGAYQIVGGLDDFQTNTRVCDIMKPFTLTGGGITLQASGGLSGTYTYTGPFNAHGAGTYTISLPDGIGKPGTMTGGGAGSAAGYTGSGTEKYTLTPLEPCQ